jgi:hypothetical protein
MREDDVERLMDDRESGNRCNDRGGEGNQGQCHNGIAHSRSRGSNGEESPVGTLAVVWTMDSP